MLAAEGCLGTSRGRPGEPCISGPWATIGQQRGAAEDTSAARSLPWFRRSDSSIESERQGKPS
eukprot:1141378-Pelagomonas_calceolata.AAC.2